MCLHIKYHHIITKRLFHTLSHFQKVTVTMGWGDGDTISDMIYAVLTHILSRRIPLKVICLVNREKL
jgi:hypothetical protein